MPKVQEFAGMDEMSEAAAAIFSEAVSAAAAAGRDAYIAVSGGSTPKRLYTILGEEPWRNRVDWPRLQLFWVDERTVPPDHPESNYNLINQALLHKVPLPQSHVHPFPVSDGKPPEVADAYEATLKSILPRTTDGWPRFDLVLLGMGEDGHTASLFPDSPALDEMERWVVANPVSKMGVDRLTITYPVIDHAARVVFLISGALKNAILSRILGPKHVPRILPAQGIQPVDGDLLWLVTRGAAPGGWG